MAESARFNSLFSQKFDRSIFITYFLGAIVPLVAMAVLTQQYVLPIVEQQFAWGVVGLVSFNFAIGVLSLSCFFALRRIVTTTLAQMDADNARLTKLLAMSRKLSNASHTDVVAEAAAQSAMQLVDARAVYVLSRSDATKELALTQSAGDGAQNFYDSHADLIQELVEMAESQNGCAALNAAACAKLGDGSVRLTAAAAVTLPGEGGMTRGALIALHTEPGRTFSVAELDSVSTLCSLTAVAMENAYLQDTQRNFFAHVTEILVAALDEHIDGREGHATAVAQLANRLGRELEIDPASLQRLHFASLLHDIGMLKVDKTRQSIPSEFRKHSAIGHRMLSRIRLWEDIAPIVHHHHEYFDGSGYPDGLSGGQIPIEARIILVADAFDAMSRSEGARRGRTLEEILQEFEEGAGGQFDPQVVAAFRAIAERGEVTCAL